MGSILKNDKRISQNSILWNTIGSFLYAIQSTVILVVMTRVSSINEVGIFSIAYANANLFLIIGHFGMRTYQMADTKRCFSFRDYHISRIITVLIMILLGCVFVLISARNKQYTSYKMKIMIWMIVLKVVDAYEGVFHGEYQRRNRLDVAGKCLSIRIVLLIIVYCISFILYHDQLIALRITTISTMLIFMILTYRTKDIIYNTKYSIDETDINRRETNNKRYFKNLIIQCIPLFLGCFFSYYIGNAPKYSIDSVLTGEMQAYYGFVSMPVFVVELLTSFVFMPQMYSLSNRWDDKDYNGFKSEVLKPIFIMIAISVICFILAFLLGIPVLSLVYNTDLSEYKTDFLILIIGGSFLGMNGFLNSLITIIKLQFYSMCGYIIVAIIVFLSINQIVTEYGIKGAAITYAASMMVLTIAFSAILFLGIRKKEIVI